MRDNAEKVTTGIHWFSFFAMFAVNSQLFIAQATIFPNRADDSSIWWIVLYVALGPSVMSVVVGQ